MKPTGNKNINTREYWNEQYSSLDKYKDQEAGVFGETQRFIRAVEEVSDGDKVLDIGCGIGTFTELVTNVKTNCEVWGTDISDTAMHENWKRNPKIQYIACEVGNLINIPTNYFNVVFSGEVLEHLDDPKSLFLDAYNALASGGKFILTTPNGSTIKTPEHVTEFEHEDIEKLYLDNGFQRPKFVYLPNEHFLTIFAIGKK